MKVRCRSTVSVLLLAVTLLIGVAYRSALADAEHGRRIANAQCAACHGADGNSTDPRYPKLAEQNARYLYQQLVAFNRGARPSDVMSGIARTLSDAEAVDVSTFFAQQTIKPDPIKDRNLASAGEAIFFRGVGRGMVPACAMCHGSPGQRGMMDEMGMMGRGMMCGMMADVPNLYGQHATYLIDQLNGFAEGLRPSMMMGMMSRIAAALGDSDKAAVAEFLSGHPPR